MAENAASLLKNQFMSLWDDTEYTDFTIVYGAKGSRVKKVHRAVICCRSIYFKNACKKVYKEGQMGIIDLSVDDETAIEALLKFLYTGDYSSDNAGCHSILFHIKVYALAEKYQLDSLKEFSHEKEREALNKHWDVDSFLDAVRVLYASTASDADKLRKTVVAKSDKKRNDLFYKNSKNRRVLTDVPEYSRDLAILLMEK